MRFIAVVLVICDGWLVGWWYVALRNVLSSPTRCLGEDGTGRGGNERLVNGPRRGRLLSQDGAKNLQIGALLSSPCSLSARGFVTGADDGFSWRAHTQGYTQVECLSCGRWRRRKRNAFG